MLEAEITFLVLLGTSWIGLAILSSFKCAESIARQHLSGTE